MMMMNDRIRRNVKLTQNGHLSSSSFFHTHQKVMVPPSFNEETCYFHTNSIMVKQHGNTYKKEEDEYDDYCGDGDGDEDGR
jgi:hypothetical protein